MKKIFGIFIMVFMIFGMMAPVYADSGVKIKVNGNSLQNAEAIIQHGTTLLPVRSIGTALGGEVTWDAATKTAFIEKGDTQIKVPVGERLIYVNGEAKHLIVVAQVIDGRTYLPLRVIGESLDCNIVWDNKTKTVEINNITTGGNKDLFKEDEDLGPFFVDNHIYLVEGEIVPVRVHNGGYIKCSNDKVRCEWGSYNDEYVVFVEGLKNGKSRLTLSNGQKSVEIPVSVVSSTDAAYISQKKERIASGYDIYANQKKLVQREAAVQEKYGLHLEGLYDINYLEKDDVLIIPIDSKEALTGTFYLSAKEDSNLWTRMGEYQGTPAIFIKGTQLTNTNIVLRYVKNRTDSLNFERILSADEVSLLWDRDAVRTNTELNALETAAWEFCVKVVNSDNSELKKQEKERMEKGLSYDLYLNGLV